MSQSRQESISILKGAYITITPCGFETIPQLKKDLTTETRRSRRKDADEDCGPTHETTVASTRVSRSGLLCALCVSVVNLFFKVQVLIG